MHQDLSETYLRTAASSAASARSVAQDPALAALATAIESLANALLTRYGYEVA